MKWLKKLLHWLSRYKVVVSDGSRIPPPESRLCGPEFKIDVNYLGSAEAEARRLVEHFACGPQSRVLDVGCGLGRLATGLTRVVGALDYFGMDVEDKSIRWCRQNIQKFHPTYRFEHLNLYNDRYHRSGHRLDEKFRFPVESDNLDIVYLFSVFSHMSQEEMEIYLQDFHRILKKGGGLFFTTFVEDNVPPVTINPENYRFSCKGPLHIVRYERSHLCALLDRRGFTLEDFSHATETDGQSGLVLRKR